MKKTLLVSILLFLNMAFGQITFDQTRFIFGEGTVLPKSLTVTNFGDYPLLAQVWIENVKGEKVLTPLVALPVLQRINAGASQYIKLQMMTKAVTQLPQDQESLFYLNVLGIPPKDGADEYMVNLVIQMRIKMFYRPKSLGTYKNHEWLRDLQISKSGQKLTIKNPTPFHVVIHQFETKDGKDEIKKDVIISPFLTENIEVDLIGKDINIYYVGDGGGSIAHHYNCSDNSQCSLNSVWIDSLKGMQQQNSLSTD